MTTVLYKTETTRFFSDCGCVSNYEVIGTFPWRQQLLLLVRSMQTTMGPPTLYTPRSPQLQCWKLKWKRWQELITNMSNQSTPYCNIEEWGHGGWRINLMSRFLCMVVQLFIPPTILLPAQFPYSNTSVLCVVLFGTHANTICVHPIACTIIITFIHSFHAFINWEVDNQNERKFQTHIRNVEKWRSQQSKIQTESLRSRNVAKSESNVEK